MKGDYWVATAASFILLAASITQLCMALEGRQKGTAKTSAPIAGECRISSRSEVGQCPDRTIVLQDEKRIGIWIDGGLR